MPSPKVRLRFDGEREWVTTLPEPAKGARMSAYDIDLDKNPANYQPLTPLTFLARSAALYPRAIAIRHRELQNADIFQRTRLTEEIGKRTAATWTEAEGGKWTIEPRHRMSLAIQTAEPNRRGSAKLSTESR